MPAGVLQGKRAVVTGASSGLGADFARLLAEQGCHLVLVARREERLRELAGQLGAAHGIQAEVVPMDLGLEDAPQRLHQLVRERGWAIDVLVNNAGYGVWGEFAGAPWERLRAMLQVDIVALTRLTHLFAPEMAARKQGWILQVASIGAFQPCPTYAAYCAAKSYVLSFGEAIAHELAPAGVKVCVLSPGYTETEFLAVSGQKQTGYQRAFAMTSADVARIGLRALLKGRRSVVPGWSNAFGAWSVRFLPRRWAAAIAARTMRPE